MSENLKIYEAVRNVPESAKKTIQAGRLKGKTEINPMWRIKVMTEQFGPCGIGWKYRIVDKRIEPGANGEAAAFVDIDLFVKVNGEWSEAIPGTGGSAFVANERGGLYTSDEVFKMALTDAISVSCKALGVGADVYWEADATKYDQRPAAPVNKEVCQNCGNKITSVMRKDGTEWDARSMALYSQKMFGRPLCGECMKKAKANAGERV